VRCSGRHYFINQTLAYHSLAMLARLFRYGELTHHGGFVSLANGRMAPLTIPSARSPRSLKRACTVVEYRVDSLEDSGA